VLCGIRQQSHKAGLFNSGTEAALMLGTSSRFTTGLDLAAIGDIALLKATSIFVIDFADMIMTELTNFAARRALATPTPLATLATGARITASLHRKSPS
jgi:hypothetical protein